MLDAGAGQLGLEPGPARPANQSHPLLRQPHRDGRRFDPRNAEAGRADLHPPAGAMAPRRFAAVAIRRALPAQPAGLGQRILSSALPFLTKALCPARAPG